ncbi:MAG: ABC transporter permease [Armatimonadota bacterium]|nr:ABC transporter permease [Armatimonadota bacterium]MDR7436254.1 ABC transporter permease [Armatimonadota bacterium]MDR7471366.1 ABC transporter permease [Armatimonadota bacterium]MDR7506422.1 ABC transporter permease [Armatimonadota bacterium]MDR7508977.1 ABC transporter permease [Armatimonadota bacterium]
MAHVGPFRIERAEPSAGWTVVVSAGAVAAAFVVAGAIFWAYGLDPVRAYAIIVRDGLLAPGALPEVLRPTIPLLLVGAGLVLAFRAQVYNIGAEGQLLAGAVAATWVALFSGLRGPGMLPAMFAAGFAAGALWGLVPAVLRVHLRVNEVIATLMMNYVAQYLVSWLVTGPWKGPSVRGFAYTDPFPPEAWLALIPGTRIHWPTLVVGLAVAAVAALLLARTTLGFEIRIQGDNPEAARYLGVSALRTTLLVMILSGGAAGLAGVGEVAGVHHKLLDPAQVSLGYGYTGIIVAWLARGQPLAAALTAVLFGLIYSTGDVMQVSLQMPFRVTSVFNGLILFFLIGSERLLGYRIRWAPARVAVEAPAPAGAGVPPGED